MTLTPFVWVLAPSPQPVIPEASGDFIFVSIFSIEYLRIGGIIKKLVFIVRIRHTKNSCYSIFYKIVYINIYVGGISDMAQLSKNKKRLRIIPLGGICEIGKT